MSNTDPLFRSIQDPVARKRALAANAKQVIEGIKVPGISSTDLHNQCTYLRKVIDEMQAL